MYVIKKNKRKLYSIQVIENKHTCIHSCKSTGKWSSTAYLGHDEMLIEL